MEIKKILCVGLVALAAGMGSAEELIEPFPSRGHLTRTFAQMEASTAENPATIRVLFYGQSIVRQNVWCEHIIADWQKRYPTVKFVVRNLSVGGYTTDALSHCIESDIFPFYPDVLFFHDYGDVLGGYGYMLGEVRKRTTAEIVIWSSHFRYDEDPATVMKIRAGVDVPRKGNERNYGAEKTRTGEMRALADDLDLVFVDLQGSWAKLLLDNKWGPKVLLEDTVHMNGKAFPYYSKILVDALTPDPKGAGECVFAPGREYGQDGAAVERKAGRLREGKLNRAQDLGTKGRERHFRLGDLAEEPTSRLC